MEPIVGVKNNDEHSPDFLNMSIPEVLQGGDFEIRFESGPDSVGKLSQVTTEITCVNGVQMKDPKERGDCECGLIKPHMMGQIKDDDPRDHNRGFGKQSLGAGDIEIETPWMEYDDKLKTFVVTIGDNYKLSYMDPKDKAAAAMLPNTSIPVSGTEFVLHMTNETDAQFDETHQPACLPKFMNLRDLDNEKAFVIKKDNATGKLEVVHMRVMDRYHCNEVLSESNGEEKTIDHAVGCLMPHRRSKLCEDSIGSPIFAYTDRKAKTHLMLIGFVSKNVTKCATKKMPAPFARLNNPGLDYLHGTIMNNGSQPLLTCPDHPPINNCVKGNGETFFCGTGCCGDACCEECPNKFKNGTVICTDEREKCCSDGCCMGCPLGNSGRNTTCPQGKKCCENGDGCCSECDDGICESSVAMCQKDNNLCQDYCGSNLCNGKCCDNDPSRCCNVCKGTVCDLGAVCRADGECMETCGGKICTGGCCAADNSKCCLMCPNGQLCGFGEKCNQSSPGKWACN